VLFNTGMRAYFAVLALLVVVVLVAAASAWEAEGFQSTPEGRAQAERLRSRVGPVFQDSGSAGGFSAGTYRSYRRALRGEGDPVQFSDLRRLARDGRLTARDIEPHL
jgi:hypothetical protein